MMVKLKVLNRGKIKMKKLVSVYVVLMVLSLTICLAASGDKTYEDGYKDGLNAGYDEGYSDGLGDGKEKVPTIVFKEKEEIEQVEAGSEFVLEVPFENDSSFTAYDLTIVPVLENTPLVYERPLKYKMNKSLRAKGEGVAKFSLKVSEDAKIGTYGIKFKLEYQNAKDETFSREETAYFKVTTEKSKPVITVSSISTGLEKIKAGDVFTLSFNINNIGGSCAEDMEVSVDGFSQSTFMPIDSKDFALVGDLEKGKSITQTFDIITSKDISSKNNVLQIHIKYKDASDTENTISKNVYITDVDTDGNVDEDDEKTARPKMIISSYGIAPNNVVAGDVFSFGFTFKNTSKEKKIRNIKITLSSEEGAFIITKGSNTFYIEEMEKEASLTREIELKAKQDLASNSYKVNIDFDYEDFNGSEYRATETINIPVTEYSKLVINSVYAGEGYVNGNTNLSFDYVNMGKATISNLTASVEGDYTSAQSINYIGNLTAGTSDYYDIEVIPTKEGTNYGTLVLAFEDSSGAKIEVRKEFQGTAFAENFFEPDVPVDTMTPVDPTMPVEEENPIATWIIVVSGIGTFFVTFIITKIIVTKIVRRKLEQDL